MIWLGVIVNSRVSCFYNAGVLKKYPRGDSDLTGLTLVYISVTFIPCMQPGQQSCDFLIPQDFCLYSIPPFGA